MVHFLFFFFLEEMTHSALLKTAYPAQREMFGGYLHGRIHSTRIATGNLTAKLPAKFWSHSRSYWTQNGLEPGAWPTGLGECSMAALALRKRSAREDREVSRESLERRGGQEMFAELQTKGGCYTPSLRIWTRWEVAVVFHSNHRSRQHQTPGSQQ